MFTLVAFSIAGATAGAWGVMGGFAAELLTRGGGLALLAALPLYAAGSALGSIAVLSDNGRGVAVAAAAGGSAGAIGMGLFLVPTLIPLSMFGFCLVALSGAALIHGRVLDGRPEEILVDEAQSLFGRVRVVDHIWGARRIRQRRLTVEGQLLGGSEDDAPLRSWELAVTAALSGDEGAEESPQPANDLDEEVRDTRPHSPESEPAEVRPSEPVGEEPQAPILLLGGAGVVLIRTLLQAGRRLIVVEPNPVVQQMTVRHFGVPLHDDGLERMTAEGLHTLPAGLPRVSAALVDGGAWWTGRPLPIPSTSALRRLRALVEDDGVLYLGGPESAPLLDTEAKALLCARAADAGWAWWAVFRGVESDAPGRGLVVLGSAQAIPTELLGMKRIEEGPTSPPAPEPAPGSREDAPSSAEVPR
jgi:hypothetical protein